MVEIKGFDMAYKNMLAERTMKRIANNAYHRRVKQLIDEGVSPAIAKVMAKSMQEARV